MTNIVVAVPNRRDEHSGFMAVSLGIAFGYIVVLGILLFQHRWIAEAGGIPIRTDFLAYRAAGIVALRGNAVLSYDPRAFHLLQVSLSKPFPSDFYWNYPPSFFFVVAALATLPYVSAYLLWVGTTAIAYAIATGRIVCRQEGIAAAIASPIFLLTAYVGQNGFLSAALLGGFLLCLRERPVIAGALLGLMTYKPQFGVLLPLALIAGGHWRALLSAFVTTAILTVAAVLAFGTDSHVVFLHSLAIASRSYLTFGGEGWPKIESVYSVARFLGGNDSLAWLVQFLTGAACAVGVFGLWRSRAVYELKAAALIVASMLSIPYLHEYDFPVIVVALAFLWRHRPFDRAEWAAVAAVNILMAAFLFQLAPIGPLIVMITGVMLLRRLVRSSALTSEVSREVAGANTELAHSS